MTLLTGVELQGLKPPVAAAMSVADSIFRRMGKEMLITSVRRGNHTWGFTSKAFRIGVDNLSVPEAMATVNELKGQIGGEFAVELKPDHIQVKYSPNENER